MPMRVSVKCFASVRALLGFSATEICASAPLTIAEVWARFSAAPPPPNLLCARNLEYADWSQVVSDGDEVAFFPPVTGG